MVNTLAPSVVSLMLENPMVTKLRQIMQQRGISIGELARQTGLTKSYISNVLNGRQTDIRVTNLRRIADALEVPPGELLEEEDAPQPDIQQLAAERAPADKLDEIRRLAFRILSELDRLQKQLPEDSSKNSKDGGNDS